MTLDLAPEKADEIVFECYRRMYAEAEPKADFDKMFESGECKEKDWYLKYFLEEKRQDEIIDEVAKKFKLNKWIKKKLYTTVTLGSSPTVSRGGQVQVNGEKK